MQSMIRISLLFVTAILLVNCATTTIQTGSNQYTPSEFGENDPEASFFNEMSTKDAAYNDDRAAQDTRLDDEEEISGKDCPCDTKNNDVVVADREAEEAKERRETYYDKPAREEQPVEYTKPAEEQTAQQDDKNFNGMGTASWYGRDFDGKPTASGEIYDSRKLTAAHKEIPLGSIVLVRNMENDKEVLVTVNDRGPFVKGRILDMSEYGAEMLGYKEQGLTTVQLKVVRLGKGRSGVNRGATFDFFGSNDTGDSDIGGADDAETMQRTDEILSRKEGRAKRQNDLQQHVQVESKQRGFAVQVGNFADLRNAGGMRRLLQASGIQDVQIYARNNGMYVVRVGQFDSREQAQSVQSELIAEGYRAFIAPPQH